MGLSHLCCDFHLPEAANLFFHAQCVWQDIQCNWKTVLLSSVKMCFLWKFKQMKTVFTESLLAIIQ